MRFSVKKLGNLETAYAAAEKFLGLRDGTIKLNFTGSGEYTHNTAGRKNGKIYGRGRFAYLSSEKSKEFSTLRKAFFAFVEDKNLVGGSVIVTFSKENK